MSREPVHIQAAKGAGRPYGRRAIWAAIRELGARGPFTQADIRLALPHIGQYAIEEYLRALVKAGYVAAGEMIKLPLSSSRARQYSLARDIGVDAPRLNAEGEPLPPTGQQRMWTAMKIIGWFSPAELAESAGAGGARVTELTARDYIRHLKRANYLQVSSDGKKFRLIDNTGGLAPLVERTKVVFDPNENRLRWIDEQ